MSENDISMVDVSDALDSISRDDTSRAPGRRKSTLILTEEAEAEKMHVDENAGTLEPENGQNGPKGPNSQSQNQSQQNQPGQSQGPAGNSGADKTPPEPPAVNVPVDITWVQGGEKVYVTGSFTGWRKMIGLQIQPDGSHVVTLGLPVGTHRFRFVIDNELRFSDFLPTATDQMGNFVNYVEVTPDHVTSHLRQQREYDEEQRQKTAGHGHVTRNNNNNNSTSSVTRRRAGSVFGLTGDDDDMGNGYSRYYDEDSDCVQDGSSVAYTSDIPPIFVDAKVMEQYYMAVDEQAKASSAQQQAWLHAPQLPPQLDNVILNNFNAMDRHNNSGALPIPNHVVLNHLATTSIKHNTLAVASVVRYKRKYVTQVLYAPLS